MPSNVGDSMPVNLKVTEIPTNVKPGLLDLIKAYAIIALGI
jgi:hypothetical protein